MEGEIDAYVEGTITGKVEGTFDIGGEPVTDLEEGKGDAYEED